MTDSTPAHLAATRSDAPAAFAFAHLSDGRKLGRWTLGSMDLEPAGEPGLWRGTSLFDGAEALVEIRPEPRLGLIDFHLGPAGARVPRVSIRVTPGPDWGLPETACLAAMTTWRAGWMDEARWERTRKSHELEVLLFRAQIEADWKAAT
ncbi:MAG: SRPBCC family protein [Paracoccaceae bacterium]|nr:SRPBCC family protein [Paracoccaceae bacterium]